MNKVFIAGRLAADPQAFVTQTGKSISNISIACSDSMNKNEVYFFPCTAWQSNANFINTYLKKGDSVIVDGKLIRRSYVSKEGKTVYTTEVVVDTIKSFGNSRRNQDNYNNSTQNFNNQNNNYNNNYNNQNRNYNNEKINKDDNLYFDNNEIKDVNSFSNSSSFNGNNGNLNNNLNQDNFKNQSPQNIINDNLNQDNFKNQSPQNIINDNSINEDDIFNDVDLDWLDDIDK